MDENTTPTGEPGAAPGTSGTTGAGQGHPGQYGRPVGHASTGSPAQSGPRVSWAQVQDISRLYRPHDRMLTGVAAGVARHLDVDPLLIRIGFVVLSFFGGAGVLLYGALWLLLPEDGAERAVVHLDARNRRLAVIGAVVVAGLAALGNAWTFSWGVWPLVLVALVVWLFWSKNESSRARPDGSAAPAPTPYAVPYAAPEARPDAGPAAGPAEAAPAPAQAAAWTLPVPQPAPAWTPQPPTHAMAGPGSGGAADRPAPPRPADPRARGPVLFWITAALIALGIGILGMADVAGLDVVDSAYPALALALTAAMLVVGAFWGRAGGLVALGLLLGLVTFGSVSNEHWREDAPRLAPTSAAQVPQEREFSAGRMVLDLSDVSDPEALDGRTVTLVGGVGAIDVIVPEGIALKVRAEVGGPGGTFILGQRQGGIAIEHQVNDTSGDSVALMTLDLEVGVGKITVKRSGMPEPNDTSVSPEPGTDPGPGPSTEPVPDVPSIDIDPEAGDQR